MREERITGGMSLMDMIVALAEGNPGAISVMMQMVERGADIDPRSALGPISGILSLDGAGIYGPAIWILYKDICGQDLVKTLAVLRAVQLGILPEGKLAQSILDMDEGRRDEKIIDPDKLLEEVRKKLTIFGGMSEEKKGAA